MSMPFVIMFVFVLEIVMVSMFAVVFVVLMFMAVFMLVFVVVRLLNLTIFGELATFFAMLYMPFHMYRQLRGAYRSSRPGAMVRMSLLLFFSLFAMIAFLLLLLALGAMG